MLFRLRWFLKWLMISFAGLMLLTYSSPRSQGEEDRVRAYTRDIEFDYISWMANASRLKVQQGAAGIPGYLTRESSTVAVSDYLFTAHKIIQTGDALNRLYADPSILDKRSASASIRARLALLDEQQSELAPIAEAVLQGQVDQVAADFGLALLGQPIPTVLFHSSAVPDALIVSPRDHIEQIVNISINPEFTVDRQAALEDRVAQGLGVSSLVVPIGGVGVYPTMIMQTTDLAWLVNTISHEWTHNYLSLRPLGLLYDSTPELRTMNETTADISGGEIGAEVMKRYYPAFLSSNSPHLGLVEFPGSQPGPDAPAPPPFDFNTEMHTTRVTADALLAQKKITEAETYMEQRRQMFLQNGYNKAPIVQSFLN